MDRPRIAVLDDEDSSTLARLRAGLAATCEIECESPLPKGEIDLVVLPLSSAGLATMGSLKDRDPSSPGFLFVYSAGQESDISRALREGAFYCLPRPVDAQVARAVVGRALDVAMLRKTSRDQANRLDGELAEARALQRAMLPPAEGRLGKSGVSVAVRNRPCAEVGGDVVDYAESGGRAALLIADVAGHGIGAAMLTTVLKSAFAASAGGGYEPAEVIASMQRALAPFAAERFVTAIVARIDRGKRTIEYINAGHPAGWLFHRGHVIGELKTTTPLIMPGTPAADLQSQSITIPENAGLLLYTDGLCDARSLSADERFGSARIRDELSRHPGGGAALLDGILTAVDAFTGRSPQPDDITLLTASIGLPGLA